MTRKRSVPHLSRVRSRPCVAVRRRGAVTALVTVLLGGLLAMHGLGTTSPPVPAPASAAGAPHAATGVHPGGHGDPPEAAGHRGCAHHGEAPGPTGQGADAHGVGAHEVLASHAESHGTSTHDGAGHGQGGHIAHADAACAAHGTSGPPDIAVPEAGTPAGTRNGSGGAGLAGTVAAVPERAPPSIHELQLLRI